MSDITYSDKVNTGSGTTRKWRYLDANEVKTAVNSKADKRPISTTLSGTTWDGSPVRKTLSSNTDITFSSTKREGFMIVKQDGTGGRTFAINGTSVPINSGANAKTVISFILDESASEYVFTYETNVIGVTGGDTTPPTVVSITIENAAPTDVVITYNEALLTSSVPATSAFSVLKNGGATGLSSTAVTGSTAKVILSAAAISTDTFSLSYVVPGSNPIKDVAGNSAAAITSYTVTNNVGGMDSDAAAGIAAEVALGGTITSPHQTAASNIIVTLKGITGSIWTNNLVGVYLNLGTGVINWKNALNTDPAFRLKQGVGSAATFGSGGWTFDGVDDFLNTNIVPSVDLSLYGEGYAFAFTGFTEDNAIFGHASSGTSSIFCGAVTPTSGEHVIQGGTLSLSAYDTSSGRFVFSKRDNGDGTTNTRVIKNGTLLTSSDNTAAGTAVAHEIYLGAYNNNNGSNGGAVLWSATTLKVMIIWKGNLTNAQCTSIDSAVATYLTAVGR